MGYSQHVQTLNEGVIQKKHDSGQVPRCLGIPEQHLANVTNIPGFRVSKAELPGAGVSELTNQKGEQDHPTRRSTTCRAQMLPARRSR